MLEMLCDVDVDSLKNLVFIILVGLVLVHSAEQIFLLQCPEQRFITHFITNFSHQGTCAVVM